MTFPENPAKESSPGQAQVTSGQIDRNSCPVDCILAHSKTLIAFICLSD